MDRLVCTLALTTATFLFIRLARTALRGGSCLTGQRPSLSTLFLRCHTHALPTDGFLASFSTLPSQVGYCKHRSCSAMTGLIRCRDPHRLAMSPLLIGRSYFLSPISATRARKVSRFSFTPRTFRYPGRLLADGFSEALSLEMLGISAGGVDTITLVLALPFLVLLCICQPHSLSFFARHRL